MYATGFTGIGRYTAELIQNLARLDHKTEFVVFLNPVEFKTFKCPAKNFRAVRVSARHYSAAEQTTFLAALLRERLDLMHFTHFNAPLLYTGRSVVTIHDLTLSMYPGQKMTSVLHRSAYNAVLRRSVSRARQIIVVSKNTKQDLQRLLQTPTAKINVIYNGVGREFRPAKSISTVRKFLTKKYDLKSDYLLYTGVWRDHKNLLGLLDALGELRRTKQFGGKLIITGRPDPVYAPTLRMKVKALGLTKAVIFTGLVSDSDLLKFYQAARAFVFPSFYEGFGLPPLEAMACGIPVAASDTSATPVICGKRNAVFFDPRKPKDMAAQIWQIWSDIRLRRTLTTNGKKRVKELDWNKMAKETLVIYKDVLK